MNILGYSSDGEYIRVLTDNSSRPEFVYPANRFSSMSALIAEIEKSISHEALRKERVASKVVVLKDSLRSAGAVEVVKEVLNDGLN